MKLEDYLIPPQRHISAEQVRATNPAQAPIFIVLDDDPTGSQSVVDLPALTTWTREDFLWAFAQKRPAIYVLTNSRSLDIDHAKQRIQEIVTQALQAAQEANVSLTFVSRSDANLRTHFPVEVGAIQDSLPERVDGIILLPAFPDAGLVTVNGVHLAQQLNGKYIEVGTTSAAQHKTFGYEQSFLPRWVEEKSDGQISHDKVSVITLEMLRTAPSLVYDMLKEATDEHIFAVDCIGEADMRAFAMALANAEGIDQEDPDYRPRTFIYQVGPPFVRARIGQDVPNPLESTDIHQAFPHRTSGGGLIVVGACTPHTSRQLAHLHSAFPDVKSLGIRAEEIINIEALNYPLDDDVADDPEALRHVMANPNAANHVDEIVGAVLHSISYEDVVIHTPRTPITGHTDAQSQVIADLIADALVAIETRVFANHKPNFIIAKGRITASDMVSQGISMHRGRIVGQLGDGLITLMDPYDGPCEHVPFVIFAGKVGRDDGLTHVVQQLKR